MSILLAVYLVGYILRNFDLKYMHTLTILRFIQSVYVNSNA